MERWEFMRGKSSNLPQPVARCFPISEVFLQGNLEISHFSKALCFFLIALLTERVHKEMGTVIKTYDS